MKRKQRSSKPSYCSQLQFATLEKRNLLANDLLPDIFAWASEERGYLYDYEIEGDLLRFTTAFANQGVGNLEVFGGDVLDNGNQEVWQRIYDDEGGHRDRLAGEFTYHEGHGHIHFDGYAIYNLREINEDSSVGDIVATGGKISFCLIDITRYHEDAGSSQYGSCGTTQGVTAGWSDVYSKFLPDQWINISGVPDGDYYLEVITDPEEQLEESDETNNTTIITVTINGGPGDNGDRLEPNNSFATAHNFGVVSSREEVGLSLHTDQDVDYYQFNAVEEGTFDIQIDFTHALGNIDAFVYDSRQNLITSSESETDLEFLTFDVEPDTAYYLKIESPTGDTNGYEIDMEGPGDLVTVTVMSDDVPVDIPDSNGSSTPGQTATSTLEGPDITLTDLNVIFEDLTHTYMGDLNFKLTSPAGTTVTFIHSTWEDESGPLGSGNNFSGTFLDDQDPTGIDDGTAPYTGSYNVNYGAVNNPFSAFNGESALGTWTVSITDWFQADTGTLREWGLMFTGLDNNPGDSLEQNDAFPQATDLGTIGTASYSDLSIHKTTDVDFFRFLAQDSTYAQIDLTFTHDDGNIDFVVYDSNQQEIARSDSITNDESLRLDVDAGELYYIEVFGFEGDTNNYEFAIDVPDLVIDSGIIDQVDENWQTINLANHFDNPVIIPGFTSINDRSPVTLDISNVTSNSFDIRLNTWSGQSLHNAEAVTYLVVEAGYHTLRDGTQVSAGHTSVNGQSWTDVSFGFDATPVVFAQVENATGDAFATRLQGVSSTGFSALIQREESQSPSSTPFVGHWLAIEQNSSTDADNVYQAAVTGDRVNHRPHQIQFDVPFVRPPGMLTQMQTFNDAETANVRSGRLSNRNGIMLLQEDQTQDRETIHKFESVGWFAFEPGIVFYADESSGGRSGGGSDDGDRGGDSTGEGDNGDRDDRETDFDKSNFFNFIGRRMPESSLVSDSDLKNSMAKTAALDESFAPLAADPQLFEDIYTELRDWDFGSDSEESDSRDLEPSMNLKKRMGVL